MSYSFHPAAEAEYLEAIRYYESKRPGLGAALLADFESVIDTVCAAPRTQLLHEHARQIVQPAPPPGVITAHLDLDVVAGPGGIAGKHARQSRPTQYSGRRR